MHIGVFGGCFNPVHHGHLRLAVEALEILGLDHVLLVPARVPPHKSRGELLPYGLRCRLIRSAIRGLPAVQCSLVEGGRPGPSYTGDTLDALRQAMPEARLYFLLGVPDLLTLPSWRQGLALFQKADFVAVARQDMALETTDRFLRGHWPGAEGPFRLTPSSVRIAGANTGQAFGQSFGRAVGRPSKQIWRWRLGADSGTILLIQPPSLDISATMIREYWRGNRDLRFLLPEPVLTELERMHPLVRRFWGSRAENPGKP